MDNVFAFSGNSYDEKYDAPRLTSQLQRVFAYMQKQSWVSLHEIIEETGTGTTASVSARLRDLRKPQFGGHTVDKRRREGEEYKGVWEYNLTINSDGVTPDNQPTAIQMDNLGHTNYQDYLESQHWIDFRDDYFSRNPRRCTISGDLVDIQLHHISYINIGKETDDDVIPLCEKMHQLVHELNENRQIPLRECHIAVQEVINAVLEL